MKIFPILGLVIIAYLTGTIHIPITIIQSLFNTVFVQYDLISKILRIFKLSTNIITWMFDIVYLLLLGTANILFYFIERIFHFIIGYFVGGLY